MNIEHYKEVERVFVEVVELDIDERAERIRQLSDDSALIDSVHMLLDEHDRLATDGFMGSDILGASADPHAPMPVDSGPKAVQGYSIIRVLGRGASSTVYLAQSPLPLDRPVALKLIHVGAGKQTLARFQEEQRILADLHHDGIAEVFDEGVSEDGRPFTVLEYIEGESITQYCKSHVLGWRDTVELLIQCCEAVAHAHQRNIIHRDIKPSNLLVTLVLDSHRVKVIDFGTAKLIDPFMLMTQVTIDAQFVGTLPYSSPEQLSEVDSPDTRTDIHAIGVVLFECLQGEHPFYRDGIGIKSIVDRIMTQPVPELASNGSMPTKELNAIICKACAKSPSDRYSSLVHFAEDMQYLLAGLPVRAVRAHRFYITRKFILRHRASLGMMSIVLLMLAFVAGIAVEQGLEANKHRNALRETAIHMVDDLMPMLADLSGSSDARHELASSMVERIDELLLSTPSDQDLLLRRAYVLEYESDIVLAKGDVDQSHKLRIEATQIIESLLQNAPTNNDLFDRTQRRLTIKLGDIAKAQRDYSTALMYYEKNHELLLAAPGDHREGICWSLERLSWIAKKQQRTQDSLGLAQKRLTLTLELLEEQPDSVSYLHNAAMAHQILASYQRSLTHFAQSLAHSQSAMAFTTTLINHEPDNYSSQEMMLIASSSLTRSLYFAGHIEEGTVESKRLVRHALQLVESNPGRDAIRLIAWNKLFSMCELWERFDPAQDREPIYIEMQKLLPGKPTH